jgi:hypothetical protein
MFKQRGFDIPVIHENLDSQKKQLKEIHKLPDEKLDLLLTILSDSKKSSMTLLETDDETHEWNDGLYNTVIQMFLKCPTSSLETVIKMKNLKFPKESIPINYLTKIIRSGIQSRIDIDKLIDEDIHQIRNTIKENKNISELSNSIPKEFNLLIKKINRMEISRENKLYLTGIVNDHHRRFQEWITTKM